ncbi:type II and III secretion system protein family protein [Acidisoma silvae]|uniref:Type II and III secretion system protein family protein n=1 Tax=Acidisoma silvae TaxID=2802396 RepID=A0A963YS43_9PROT|nr:type II and III secretion system protein family protein [Acidisoma silvae]MCB8875901.1 type II and III secretion system protein family protein [Acidisoma silvae]
MLRNACLAIIIAAALFASHAAVAAAPPGIALTIGTGKIITLRGNAANIFVANPKVAEVKPASANSLFVFGIAPGETTIAATGADGRSLGSYNVTVQPSSFSADEAEAAINAVLPGLDLKVHAEPNGLSLTGQVQTPEQHATAVRLANGFLDSKQSLLDEVTVAMSTQVTLQVRIAEIDRSVTRELGANWAAVASIGSSALTFAVSNPITDTAAGAASLAAPSVSAVIEALAEDNLAKILAEPTLTVMSGQAASFEVGGQYPIPVAEQNGTVTIDFKSYGVSLKFLPTVLSSGRINLHVQPEVSELTTQGAITLTVDNSAIQIPALLVRQAETTVELGSGQSFAIAGLLETNETHDTTGVPILGDIPYVGALFRSNNLVREEKELVILITPYIVRPVDNPAALNSLDADSPPPSDLERLLQLRQVADGQPKVPMQIPGSAGFIVQ